MSTEILKEILAYIDEHIYEKISLLELAEMAGYSPFYFSKLFSEIMGMPITGYIRIRKLQYALGSLLEGRKVLDVSLMYAFDSHEGFTRSFTQLFGSTPSKVKKYLTSYMVPEYCVPNIEGRRMRMGADKESLIDNMHQIVYEVLKTSFEEADAGGFCTEINITLYEDGRIKITDNGRGIPLSQNEKTNQQVLDKILSGHPISIMGMPITGYIRIRKLQYALGSLLEGRKVLDVSLMYAFDSHEGFTRSFTQLFGSTPSKVKKYLTSYMVPEYCVPNIEGRRMRMGADKESLIDNMHQIVYEVLKTSFEEADAGGFCTEINITLYEDGRIKITDNGRGIPLSQNEKTNQQVLDKILSGHPISSIEYAQMGDFAQGGMQVINSLCENLRINVYRDSNCYSQDYVRGIAQHDVNSCKMEHLSGTEIILKPDSRIFGDIRFSTDMIQKWVEENNVTGAIVCIKEQSY